VRIVVTGASGNVGTALLRRLVGRGHSLLGVSRRRPPDVAPYDIAEWATIDLAASGASGQLAEAMRGADAIVHAAWAIQPTHDRETLRRTNQDGTRAVLRAADAADVPHLVHISSLGTYAPAPDGQWVDETWPATGVPSSWYSVDKAACEAMLDDYEQSAGAVRIARMRPGLVLQPDAASEISRYFLGRFVPAVIVRPGLLRFAPWPRALRAQFVHADDLAAALEAVLDRQATGAFNVATEPVVDRRELQRMVGTIAPAVPMKALRIAADLTWRVHLQPTDAGWIDLAAAVPLMRTDRARTELGWQPAHTADETLLSFLRSIGERRGAPGPLLHPRRLFGR
jgi:UDP-glucose 4-epimerase